MVWIIILIFLLLIPCWLLFAPLRLRVDTRIPQASLRWVSIGSAIVVFENEQWLLRMNVLFFHKQWELEKLIPGRKKKKRKAVSKPRRKKAKSGALTKFLNLVKTFRVVTWEVALDTGDSVENAWLYSLNFTPYTRDHVLINFTGENYLVAEIRNAPWKLAYAFLK